MKKNIHNGGNFVFKLKAFLLFFSLFTINHHLFSQVVHADSSANPVNNSSSDSARISAYRSLLKNSPSIRDIENYVEAVNSICDRNIQANSKDLFFVRSKIDFLSAVGDVLREKGLPTLANEYYFKCMKLAESYKDRISIASSYNSLGAVFSDQNNNKQAEDYYKKAIALLETEPLDMIGLSVTNSNLGDLYLTEGNPGKALEHLRKGLAYIQKTNDLDGLSFAYNNLGIFFRKTGMNDSAFHYYKLSLELREKLNNKSGIASSLSNLTRYYLEVKDYSNAEKCALRSMRIGEELNSPGIKRNAANKLYQVYKKTGRIAQALENYETYITLRDSLTNQDLMKKGMDEQFRYQYAQKAAEDSLRAMKEKHDQDVKLAKSEAQLKSEKTARFALIAGIMLVIGFAALMYNRYQLTRRQKNIIVLQKDEVDRQKHIIEEKQKEIIDSIQYAEKIQKTLIANHDFVNQNIPDSFVVFKPRDIVSGDFYWATSVDSSELRVRNTLSATHNSELPTPNSGHFYLAVCDSTGHGVPGAFMSLLNISFLNEAINEKRILDPGEIFNHVRKRLIDNISQQGRKDGMDGVLLCFSTKSDSAGEIQISYSAANNAPLLISAGQVVQLDCDKMPIGKGEKEESFKTFSIHGKKGDMLYLFTDGYADQFGGPKGKKFKYRQLEQLLLRISSEKIEEQRTMVDRAFEEWKGKLEQIDDVCIIGIRL